MPNSNESDPITEKLEYNPTERFGVHAAQGIVIKELGWIFREQPITDMGIDAHIELVDNSTPTGRLIGVQIKTGPSYFRETKNGYIFHRGKLKHLRYWSQHSLPVILVGHLPEKNETFWVQIDPQKVHRNPKSWTIEIPKSNRLDRGSRGDLLKVFDGTPTQQRLRNLSLAEPLMRHLKKGKKISIEMEDWVNKGLGRSNIRLFLYKKDGSESLEKEWFYYFQGYTLKSLAEAVFPWASVTLDRDFYDEWREENETFLDIALRHDDSNSGYADERPNADIIYPYTNESGEVDMYRFELTLNKLGKAFLVLSDFLKKN